MIVSLHPAARQETLVVLWLFIMQLRRYEPGLVKWIERFVDDATYGFFPYGIEAIRCPHPYNFFELQKLVIPNTVRWVGAEAFAGSMNLLSVTITNPDMVIGPSAFEACYELKEVVCPRELTISQVRRSAFAVCRNLCLVAFPFRIDVNNGIRAFDLCGYNCPCCY
jgi:hypothetical protein